LARDEPGQRGRGSVGARRVCAGGWVGTPGTPATGGTHNPPSWGATTGGVLSGTQRGVQQPSRVLSGTQRGVQQPSRLLSGTQRGVQQPLGVLSGAQQHPSVTITGCNNHSGSCQAHSSTHQSPSWGATTAQGPVRRTAAPIAPCHGVQQPVGVLSDTQRGVQQPLRVPSGTQRGVQQPSRSCQVHSSTHRSLSWGATTVPGPVRRTAAPTILHRAVQQPTGILPGTQRGVQQPSWVPSGVQQPPPCPTTAWVPVRHPTGPSTPQHGVQQPPQFLSGTQQHPPAHTTGCNNQPGSCPVPNTPRHEVQRPPRVLSGAQHPPSPYNHLGSCQAPITPHHGVQEPAWVPSGTQQHPSPQTWSETTTLGPVRHPAPPSTLQPLWVLSGTQHPTSQGTSTTVGPVRHPTAPITPDMGCNSHPGPCQAPNSTHQPGHGVKQPPWALSDAQQPPSPHNRHGHCQAPNSTHHLTTALGPLRHPSPHTTGCNNCHESCQAPNTPHHPTLWGATINL